MLPPRRRWQTVGGVITDPSTAQGGLSAALSAAIGAYESQIKSERLLMHFEGKRAKGELIPTHRTFGWAEDRVSEHPVEAPLVRDLFERVCQGESVGSLVRLLNDTEVPQVRGGAGWKHGTVKKILSNRRYYGAVLEPDGTERPEVLGKWHHIISKDLFEAANASLNARRATQGRKSTNYYSTRHLLGGIITCGICGSQMRSSSSCDRRTGELYPLYRCTANKDFSAKPEGHMQSRKDGRRHASLRVMDVDEAARQALVSAFIFGPDELFPEDRSADETRRVLTRLTALEDERREIVTSLRAGLLTHADARAQFETVRSGQEPLMARLTTLRAESASAHMMTGLRDSLFRDARVSINDVAELKKHVRTRLDTLGIEGQRVLVRRLLKVRATGGRQSAHSPRRFQIEHIKVVSLNEATNLVE